LKKLRAAESGPAFVSIDVPSGWHVENGNVLDTFDTDMLISMTTPKKCAVFHEGPHYLACRFVPAKVAKKYNFEIPKEFTYKGSS